MKEGAVLIAAALLCSVIPHGQELLDGNGKETVAAPGNSGAGGTTEARRGGGPRARSDLDQGVACETTKPNTVDMDVSRDGNLVLAKSTINGVALVEVK